MNKDEKLDQNAGEPVEGTLEGRIEAILFVSGEPVRVDDLCKALNVKPSVLDKALTWLQNEYDMMQRGFCLRRFGRRVQLTTRALYAREVVRLLQPVQRQSLSQAAMETLAVIAYRQPVTRAEIEQVRGVKCDYSIQSLMNKQLIREVGRKETLGRPMLFGTTDTFLQHFGLTSLDDLPPMPTQQPTEEEQQERQMLVP